MRDPVTRAFEAVVRRDSRAPLVLGRDAVSTAADVDALARAASSALDVAPVAPGSVVALASPDGPGFLASLVALRRRDLVVLFLDAWSPPAERWRIARALGAAAILECRTPWPSDRGDWAIYPVDQDEHRFELPPGTGFIKLTSGSTGAPRGVAVSPEALEADDEQLFTTMGLGPGDRLLSAVPLAHSYGLSSLAMPALRRGVPLVLPESGSPFAPLDLAARHGATFFPTTPAWLNGLLRLQCPPAWPPTLRLVISAGAPLAPEVAARFRDVVGQPVHTFYGSSECGGICYDREGGAAERGAVGSPVEGVRVTLHPVPGSGPDDPGAVHVASASVAGGYVPDPDPRLAGGRFIAGDLASWSGGELHLAGRVDDLINVHGKKVSPREVELVIRELEGVDDVVVIGVPQPGTGGQIVRAVVAGPEGGVSAERVLSHCRERLTRHKVPRSVILVRELPRTPRGKLDRQALLSLLPHPTHAARD